MQRQSEHARVPLRVLPAVLGSMVVDANVPKKMFYDIKGDQTAPEHLYGGKLPTRDPTSDGGRGHIQNHRKVGHRDGTMVVFVSAHSVLHAPQKYPPVGR